MTIFVFIFGVIQLIIAAGAGADFPGMIGVTFFGIFLEPVFYTVVRRLTSGPATPAESAPSGVAAAQNHAVRSAVGRGRH
jgi:hypothetical protein